MVENEHIGAGIIKSSQIILIRTTPLSPDGTSIYDLFRASQIALFERSQSCRLCTQEERDRFGIHGATQCILKRALKLSVACGLCAYGDPLAWIESLASSIILTGKETVQQLSVTHHLG